MQHILQSSEDLGWVLEPEAKHLFHLAGMEVPNFRWATTWDEAMIYAEQLGYPLVAKVVSPDILHKSDVGGVVVGIEDDGGLLETYQRLSKLEGFSGLLLEEPVSGIELIVGAKIDYQFGPIVLLGMGGTGVEIYKDTTIRMAPLKETDVTSMVRSLKAHPLLEGFRGSEPIGMENLKNLLITFSHLIMDLEETIESIDLNPVMCSSKRCVVADARIMLKT